MGEVKKKHLPVVRIAVCDDESTAVDRMIHIIQASNAEENTALDVHAFTNGSDLLAVHKAAAFDIICLDIDMPGLNGFQTAKMLHVGVESTHLIFVTYKENLVFESFSFEPFGFVRKDYLETELPETLRRCIRKLLFYERAYQFNTSVGIRTFKLKEIIYFEIKNHELYISTTFNKTFCCRGTISQLEVLLAAVGFVLIHESYLINMYYIDTILKQEVKMSNEAMLPLSKYKKKAVLKEWAFFRRNWS